jgi:hypothetical protein
MSCNGHCHNTMCQILHQSQQHIKKKWKQSIYKSTCTLSICFCTQSCTHATNMAYIYKPAYWRVVFGRCLCTICTICIICTICTIRIICTICIIYTICTISDTISTKPKRRFAEPDQTNSWVLRHRETYIRA